MHRRLVKRQPSASGAPEGRDGLLTSMFLLLGSACATVPSLRAAPTLAPIARRGRYARDAIVLRLGQDLSTRRLCWETGAMGELGAADGTCRQ